MVMNLPTRKLLGMMSRIAFYSYSWCGVCKRTWNICEKHSTEYKTEMDGMITWGCFPLCEECWQDLTIEQRIPYYEDLWQDWLQQETDKTEEDHQSMLKAVREGK